MQVVRSLVPLELVDTEDAAYRGNAVDHVYNTVVTPAWRISQK